MLVYDEKVPRHFWRIAIVTGKVCERKPTQEKKTKKANSALQHVRTDFRIMMDEERLRDDTDMTSMNIVQFSKPPTFPVHLRAKFLLPLDLGRPI